MKYVGAVIFAVCASIVGFSKSKELKARAHSCGEVAALARGISSYIDRLKLPLCEIYLRLSSSVSLAKELSDGDLPSVADEETSAALSAFLERIGSGFSYEEIELCEELEEFALKKQAFYDKEYETKGVLYRSLGLIVALGAFIVIA